MLDFFFTAEPRAGGISQNNLYGILRPPAGLRPLDCRSRLHICNQTATNQFTLLKKKDIVGLKP